MLRKTLIILGGIIVLLLMLAWGYLLLFGTPQTVQEVFSDIGLGNGATPITPENIDNVVKLAENNNKLVQLSTKAVAGFVYILNNPTSSSTSSGPGKLRYAEKGTGHLCEIDLSANTETKISGTTVGQTVGAFWSKDGEAVVLTKEVGDSLSATVYLLGGNTTKTVALPKNSDNFNLIGSSTIRYSVSEGRQTNIYQQDLLSETSDIIYTIPFTDIDIFWTSRAIYVVNKPAPYLKGGVYLLGLNGDLEKVVEPTYNLSAVIDESGQYVFYSAFVPEASQVIGRILNIETTVTDLLALFAVPEKCTWLKDKFWCASSVELADGKRGRINEWYSGELSSSDILWQQAPDGAGTYVDYMASLAGFDLDVTDLVAAPETNQLFFRNKLNDTLWVYEIGE